MKKILTSFMNLSTGEGSRIAYTYSEVNEETGEVVSQNNKGNFLVMNDDVQAHLDCIKKYIRDKYLV
jgi:hypothetical protein|nr:MAG: hypothetical protein [Bacteriophage sp.]